MPTLARPTALIIPIVTLIAVPLSKVNPRQGRFSKLVPAALLYAIYYILLQVSRDQVAAGELPGSVGLWWVHVLFILIGAIVFQGFEGRSWRRKTTA